MTDRTIKFICILCFGNHICWDVLNLIFTFITFMFLERISLILAINLVYKVYDCNDGKKQNVQTQSVVCYRYRKC